MRAREQIKSLCIYSGRWHSAGNPAFCQHSLLSSISNARIIPKGYIVAMGGLSKDSLDCGLIKNPEVR